MSLPYPSMVFVPLDILTAEEMNQIVGNIESLAAGTGLNDGAITSSKIDWTTINYGEVGVDVPIGKFNNKTVYRRCETWTGFSQSGWNTKQLSSSLNKDVILNVYGMCFQVTNGAWIPIARVRPGANTYAMGLSGITNSEAQFEVGPDIYAGLSTIYLFIEYTKTS